MLEMYDEDLNGTPMVRATIIMLEGKGPRYLEVMGHRTFKIPGEASWDSNDDIVTIDGVQYKFMCHQTTAPGRNANGEIVVTAIGAMYPIPEVESG